MVYTVDQYRCIWIWLLVYIASLEGIYGFCSAMDTFLATRCQFVQYVSIVIRWHLLVLKELYYIWFMFQVYMDTY